MKTKSIQLIIILLLFNITNAQVTFENSYSTEGENYYPQTYAFHTDNGLNYYTVDVANGEVNIYDSTHTLYKTVPVSIPSGLELKNVQMMTDKLFYSDSKIEFIAVVGSPDFTTPHISKMILYNEDGTNLFDFGDRWEAHYLKASDSSYKLIVSTEKKQS